MLRQRNRAKFNRRLWFPLDEHRGSQHLDLGGERIRLFGIDAPERGQSCGPLDCGKAATEALADILSAGPVRCTRVNTDRYARTVARCKAGRVDVNREMVRRGMAWAYRQYSEDYVSDEKKAKKARIGIWKHRSQPAWEYRRGTQP